SVVVETGSTSRVEAVLEPGDVTEAVSVTAARPSLAADHHQVASVVTREQIDALPLNGRNFLELAKLEPGGTPPQRGTNRRVFVAMLGSGLQTTPRVGYTRVTVDGVSINTIGAIGTSLQLSQDAVQEFQ